MMEHPEAAPPEESGADRPRFRSWTINRAAGYERLSDSERGQILVRFTDRPFPANQPERPSVRFLGKPWASAGLLKTWGCGQFRMMLVLCRLWWKRK
jgi:hypothetical protein